MTRLRPTLSGSASHIDANPDRVHPVRAFGLVVAIVLTLIAAVLAAPTPAHAHPLGDFSINHQSTVRISDDRIEVRYLLDQAEIPTVQERGFSKPELLDRKRDEVLGGLELTVDGRQVPLALDGKGRASFPPGNGGLKTSRFEFRLVAPVDSPRAVRLQDGTFADRVGWKAIVAEPGEGTAVRTRAPSGDPTDGLRRYPEDLLNSPLDRREATFQVKPGDGTLVAPRTENGDFATSRTGSDGFAALFERAAAGEGVLALLLLAAFGWGALHALSPGHGKAMVAAYLVGTKGKARHAVALGGTVTIAHTIGVFALGFVTLALSQYVLPEDLYPWLNLVSGLLVVVIGAGVLRSRVRWARARREKAAAGIALQAEQGPSADGGHSRGHDHSHAHGHSHSRDHGHGAGLQHFLDHLRGRPHGHDHGHGHGHHGDHGHHHDHEHAHSDEHHHDHTVTKRGLIGLGAAAGLIPCPSALVVLLAAISQHEVALGLLLIVAFSLGLAGTLTALGLGVVYARKLLPRLSVSRLGGIGRVGAALPAASALVIVGVGCVLTANAIPTLM
jgi:nickel/cobalt transporter (NicO) family protein